MNGVICELCLQRPATCHLTETDGEEHRVLHVCQSCLSRLGVDVHARPPSIDSMLSQWADLQDNSGSSLLGPGIAINLKPGTSAKITVKRETDASGITCSSCGLGLDQYRKRNRFGCPSCYDAFASFLDRQFAELHGESRHAGRVPQHLGDDAEVRFAQRLHLRRQLDDALAAEDYEAAAGLRDQLKALDSAESDESAS